MPFPAKGSMFMYDRLRLIFSSTDVAFTVKTLMATTGDSRSGMKKCLSALLKAGEIDVIKNQSHLGGYKYFALNIQPILTPLELGRVASDPEIPGARVVRFDNPRKESHDCIGTSESFCWSRPAGSQC